MICRTNNFRSIFSNTNIFSKRNIKAYILNVFN